MPLLAVVGCILLAPASGRRHSDFPGPAASFAAHSGAALEPLAAVLPPSGPFNFAAAEDAVVLDRVEDDANYRTSAHFAELLGLRGGAVPHPTLATHLWPLIQRAEFPLRVGLMSWAVYDKFRRALQLAAPRPFLDECEHFFRVVAGVELHALEAMRHIFARVEHLGQGHPEVQQAHAAALQHLAEEMRRGTKKSAEYALSVGRGTFQRLIQAGNHREASVRHLALRIADAVKQDRDGKWEADGKFVDLRGNLLARAAEIDVTAELIPKHVQGKARLKLLGLIASLGHDSVFQKVQQALWHNRTHSPLMTIAEFKEKMGVDGAADLVKKLIHKYTTPKLMLHTHIALYTASHLRSDPVHFQIAWGFRLASLIAENFAQHPAARTFADGGFFAFHSVEAGHRGRQLLELARKARAGAELGAWEHLQAANAFLTVLLFAVGKTEHGQLTMATVYGWLTDRLIQAALLWVFLWDFAAGESEIDTMLEGVYEWAMKQIFEGSAGFGVRKSDF